MRHIIRLLNIEDIDFAFHFSCEAGNSVSQLYNPQLSSLVRSSSVFFFHLQHNQGGGGRDQVQMFNKADCLHL